MDVQGTIKSKENPTIPKVEIPSASNTTFKANLLSFILASSFSLSEVISSMLLTEISSGMTDISSVLIFLENDRGLRKYYIRIYKTTSSNSLLVQNEIPLKSDLQFIINPLPLSNIKDFLQRQLRIKNRFFECIVTFLIALY